MINLVVCITVALLAAESISAVDKDDIMNYAALENPFRMQKINLVWDKARLRMNLTEKKLSKLYSQLKIQDKEELTLKKLKAENGDKEGLRETEVRTKFSLILDAYGMAAVHPPTPAESAARGTKHIFKDKKLQKLWEKAEKSGLSSTELLSLQQEFQHHQEKVDEYHNLMEIVSTKDDHIKYNTIQRKLENEVFDIRDTNELKKKMNDVKNGFDRLHRLATNQGEAIGFTEPKVAGLWKIALESDFNAEELESLRHELSHYEVKLEKLRFLQNELRLVDERHDGKFSDYDDEKTEGRRVMDRKVEKSVNEVDKLHSILESKILTRHGEL